ncbi:MAG: hypothetical protein Q9195_007180 [Heterodermia aff. obscurata]
MTANLQQGVLAGKLAWLPLIEQIKTEQDKYVTKEALARELEQKYSRLSLLIDKLQDGFEHVKSLEKGVGRAGDLSLSLGDERRAEDTIQTRDPRARVQFPKPSDSPKPLETPPDETPHDARGPEASKPNKNDQLSLAIAGQRSSQNEGGHGGVPSEEGEEIEIIKVVQVRPAGETRDRPRARQERSPKKRASPVLPPYQWPPPSLEGMLEKVSALREADNDDWARRRLQGDRYRPHYDELHGSGFLHTPPRGPQAMTRDREAGFAADESRKRDYREQHQSRQCERSRSPPGLDRSRYRRPSPNRAQRAMSRARKSHGSFKLASFGTTSHTRTGRGRSSDADYGDPNSPVRRSAKWDPRSSGKR